MRVHFAKLPIHSYSRGLTRLEGIYLDLFKTHVQYCVCCLRLSNGVLPSSCRQGQALVSLIFLCFYKDRSGVIFSTDNELGRPVRVELQSHRTTVAALLDLQYYSYD